LWAFINHAPDFAWRLLTITVIINILLSLLLNGGDVHDASALIAFFICLLWIGFSINVGRIANQQIERALTKRGFIQIGEFTGIDADQAIAQAVAS
jgi:hypothetical protein